MPASNLDIKSVKNYLSGLKDKLDDLGRHL
jgi:DNA-binding CsgD family transcriptional regulator